MDVEKDHYSDRDERELLGKVFAKAGIDHLQEVDIPGARGPFTQVDVVGVCANVVILAMCCGTRSPRYKMRFDVANFGLAIDRFPDLVREMRRRDAGFVARHSDVLVRGERRRYVKLLVNCSTESLDLVPQEELTYCQSQQMKVWTREQFFYYDWISDCTYDHCRYEIWKDSGYRQVNS